MQTAYESYVSVITNIFLCTPTENLQQTCSTRGSGFI